MRQVRVVCLVEQLLESLTPQGNLEISDWTNSVLARRQDQIVLLNLLWRLWLVRFERRHDIPGQLLSLLTVQTDTDRCALARLDSHAERIIVAVVGDTWANLSRDAIELTLFWHEPCHPFQSYGNCLFAARRMSAAIRRRREPGNYSGNTTIIRRRII